MSTLCENMTPSMLRRQRRREKSRDAARFRRHKESDTFDEICSTVPIPPDIVNHLDKSAIMRLVISYIKLRQAMGGQQQTSVSKLPAVKKEFPHETSAISDDDYVNALNAFILVLSSDLDILYVSDNVKEYLGLPKLELIGQSILTYAHEGDHDEIRNCFKNTADKDSLQTLFLRMKSTLTISGKNINLKSASYKVLRCSGIVHTNSDGPYFVAQAEPIPHPANIEHFLDSKTFVTQHSPDMKFTYCDERISHLLSYTEADMMGRSFFDFCHVRDMKSIQDFFQKLFRLNQIETDQYRFLSKTGGYNWMVTQATVITNQKNHTPQCVVCVHYVVSGTIHDEALFSTDQLENSKQVAKKSDEISTNALSYEKDPDQFRASDTAERNKLEDDCSVAPLTFTELDENDDAFGVDMYYNAPSIGDPWSYSEAEGGASSGKLEDLFSDVVLDCDLDRTTAVNTVLPDNTSAFFSNVTSLQAPLNGSSAGDANQGHYRDQRQMSDNLSDSHLTDGQAAYNYSSMQLGPLSPTDSAYWGSPCLSPLYDQPDTQLRKNPAVSTPLAADYSRSFYQPVRIASDRFQEHMESLKSGYIESPPDSLLSDTRLGKHKLQASRPPPDEAPKRRRCNTTAAYLPGNSYQPPVVPMKLTDMRQSASMLLQPGGGIGFQDDDLQELSPMSSLLLQPEMNFTGKEGLKFARNLSNNCLPELSLLDCEVNAPLSGSVYLPLAADCVHALDDDNDPAF